MFWLWQATSALDAESEEAVQVSLRALMKGRTVMTIAHRLSTMKARERGWGGKEGGGGWGVGWGGGGGLCLTLHSCRAATLWR